MHCFHDGTGRAWAVIINVSALKRVRGRVGVDLYRLLDDGLQPLAALLGDPVRFVDVLFCLCQEEADKAGIADEEFGRALAGDVIARATDAFLEELVDFFPDPKVRDQLRTVLAKGRAVRDKLLERGAAILERVDPEVEALRIARSSVSSGSAPASSASTPAPSP